MIDALRIKNFKAWRDTGAIRLAPLTVVFGANSSGKSSLHQLLVMLRQTAESPDRRRVLHVGDARTPIDLGSFRTLVTGHDVDRELEFRLGWPLREVTELADSRSGRPFRATRMSFEARIAGAGSGAPRVAAMRHTASDGTADLMLGLERTPEGYRLVTEGFDAVPTPGRPRYVTEPIHFYGFPEELRGNHQNLDITADLALMLEERLRSISYLGPLREAPVRWYRWSGEEPGWVGARGERAVEMLVADREPRYGVREGEPVRSLQELTAEWLTRLGIVVDFAVTPIAEGRDEYEVRVRTGPRAPAVLLTDVGFGVSQVLPVVAAVLGAAPDSTLIFEQPEIHLHPAAQSELGDLFLEGLAVRDRGVPRGVQYIVETHSEHLLRRLMRRRAEGRVRAGDLAMYFAEPGEDGAVLRELELDEYGDIRNWPTGFFGDQMAEIAAQIRAARERRRGARAG